MARDDENWKKRGRKTRQLSQALAIPSLFLAIPLVGYVGFLIGKHFFDAGGMGFIIGLIGGFAVAIRETIRLSQSNELDGGDK